MFQPRELQVQCDWNCLDFTKDRLSVLELLAGNRMVSGARHAFFEAPGSVSAGGAVVAAGRLGVRRDRALFALARVRRAGSVASEVRLRFR